MGCILESHNKETAASTRPIPGVVRIGVVPSTACRRMLRFAKLPQIAKGLQDALRAIVVSGATIDTERPVEDILRIGDNATGTTVLLSMYNEWKSTPVTVDLEHLWMELGVKAGTHGVVLNQDAPLAQMRRAIVTHPK